ncbi:MAG: hypothetical protein HY438_00175 [DPANN group archaeon]|nr:hypothetical protein [DPANN group archaeon]
MKQATIAWIAIAVFLGAFGGPLLTGQHSASTAVSPLDFSVKSVTYSDTKTGLPFTATIVFSNSGSISASYARYNYEVFGEFGNLFYSNTDYVQVLPASGDATVTTPAYVTMPAGKYTVRVTIDSDKNFDELDETNNKWEDSLVIK